MTSRGKESKIIVTGSSTPALVDNEDYSLLACYEWSLGGHKRQYVHGRVNGRNHKMSRVIMGYPKKQVIFKNGNRLDHRKSNLVLATHQQTTFNQPRRSNNKSGYKGVSWDNEKQRWYAYIMVNGKTKYLGRYHDKKDAAIAYNTAALEIYGDEYANINILVAPKQELTKE